MSSQESHVCPWYMAYLFDNLLRRFVHNPQKLFNDLLKPAMTVADLGCGMGYFSIGMAKIVGTRGKVYAIDLQKKMVDITRSRSKRKGVGKIVHPIQCTENDLRIPETVDFALACWVVHETPDSEYFLSQVVDKLSDQGLLFVAEPYHHVDDELLKDLIKTAENVGLRLMSSPKMWGSKTAVFCK